MNSTVNIEKVKQGLIDTFNNYDLSNLDDYLMLISSKDGKGKIFKPYIPLIGKDYDKTKILFYAKAQNISRDGRTVNRYSKSCNKLIKRLYYSDCFEKEYPKDNIEYRDIDIRPYSDGIIPVLIGIYLDLKHNQSIECPNEIHNHIAVSNYYKFSLRKVETNKKGGDLNPKDLLKLHKKNPSIYPEPSKYQELNDALVLKELELLKPNVVFITSPAKQGHKDLEFLTAHSNSNDLRFDVITVNDPASRRYPYCDPSKSDAAWVKIAKKVNNFKLKGLIAKYMEVLGKDAQERGRIEIYLKKQFLNKHMNKLLPNH